MRVCVGYHPDGTKKWDDLGASEAPYIHSGTRHLGGAVVVGASASRPAIDPRNRSEAAKAAWAKRKAMTA